MEQNGAEVRTSDLALATYLWIEGHRHTQLIRDEDGRTAIWIFHGNGDVHKSAARYQAGEAFVEPRSFYTMMGRVRKELYQFLMNGAPTASEVARSPR